MLLPDDTGASGRSILGGWRASRLAPGLAYGWQGGAWVWLQLTRCGLILPEPFQIGGLMRRLMTVASSGERPDSCGSLVGAGAEPLIAALAEGIFSGFRTIMKPLIERWLRTIAVAGKGDVVDGSAGALLAAAEIESLLPGSCPAALARKTQEFTIQFLQMQLSRALKGERVYLGLAHGIAGFLAAIECGRAAFGMGFPAGLRGQAMDLLESESLRGPRRASVWPVFSGSEEISIQGWCHGAPGIGLGLLAAHKLSGWAPYLALARRAITGTWKLAGGPEAIFCCGGAGRAQIMLEAYRQTGESPWRSAADEIARTIRQPMAMGRRGFHRGRLGFTYLQWRLRHPRLLPLPGLGILSCSAP